MSKKLKLSKLEKSEVVFKIDGQTLEFSYENKILQKVKIWDRSSWVYLDSDVAELMAKKILELMK